MTFAEIQLAIYRALNQGDTPAAGVIARVKQSINSVHRDVLARPGMELLRDDTFTFASVAAQARYGLSSNIAFIKAVSERTNQWRLEARSLSWLRTQDPGLVASGNPSIYVPIGWMQVQIQPPAATGLWAVSSAAGDTTQDVFTESFRTGGYLQKNTTRLTGTTRVLIGTSADHVEVDKFYLSAVGVGTISLFDASSGGNELARIAIGQLNAHYYGIQLWPTPGAAVTYYVDYTRQIVDMVNDTDEPLLPLDFHDLIADGVKVKEYEKADDTRLSVAKSSFDRRIGDLQYRILNPADYKPVRGADRLGYSNLGGWYPSGTW